MSFLINVFIIITVYNIKRFNLCSDTRILKVKVNYTIGEKDEQQILNKVDMV